MAPLRAEWIEALPTRSGVAAVTPPVGATTPSRVVVGVHGAGDRPEWSCGGWRLASQNTAFIVCPRGRPLSASTFAWSSTDELERRAEDALAALYERYGAYVDAQANVYAGFSQGATLAGTYLRAHAARFPIAILAEGGYPLLQTPAFTRAYYAAGGRRLVLVCGTPGCFAHARRAKQLLSPVNVEILIVGDEKAGHNLNERLQRALQEAWADITAPLPPSR
jgi:predicted esterase